MKKIEKINKFILILLLSFNISLIIFFTNIKDYPITHIKSLRASLGAIETVQIEDDCPIIFVPGVMASNLYSDKECTNQLWAPSVKDAITSAILVNTSEKFGKKLDIKNPIYVKNNMINLNTLETGKREYGAVDSYKTIIDDICTNFPDREVYFFSYDFRASNSDTAKKLHKEIEDVMKKSNKQGVDIITHSMGGLIASDYVAEYGNDRIRKLVAIAAPFYGAPKLINAVLNWEVLSENTDHDLDSYISAIPDTVIGLAGLTYNVKSKFPSLAELAPTKELFDKYTYYNKVRSGILKSNDKTTELSYENYEKICSSVFNSLYSDAKDFHETINQNDTNSLANMQNSYFIIGNGLSTICSLEFETNKSLSDIKCKNIRLEKEGDGTVPYASATLCGRLFEIENANERILELKDSHVAITTNKKSLDYLKNILGSKLQY